MDVVFVFIFLAIFQPALVYTFEEKRQVPKDHRECPPFFCGKLGELKSPYTNTTNNTECPFVVVGCDKDNQSIQFTRGGKRYEVESISQADVITITDKDFKRQLNFNSCESFNNLSLSKNIPQISRQFEYSTITLFKCHTAVILTSHFDHSYQGCKNFSIYYNSEKRQLPSLPANCSIIQLPANKTNSYSDIFRLLTAKFSLKPMPDPCFKCRWIGKICQNSKGNFQCVENQKSRGTLVHISLHASALYVRCSDPIPPFYYMC